MIISMNMTLYTRWNLAMVLCYIISCILNMYLLNNNISNYFAFLNFFASN